MSIAARRLLVAGMGFLGRELARQALAGGWEVAGLGRTAPAAAELPAGVEWLTADLADPDSLRRAAEHAGTFAWMVHCASSGRGGVERYREVYQRGCENLLAVFDEARLGFTSSTSVFGQSDGGEVDEDTPVSPPTPTSRVLAETEEQVREAGGTVLRLAGLYGPGRSVLLQRFLDGESVIETGRSRWINQIQVEDAASAWCTILEAEPGRTAGAVFHAADGQPLTQRQVQEFLANHFQRSLPPEAPPDPSRKRGLTHKKVVAPRLRALGWQPRFSGFGEAVRRGGA